MIRLRIIALLSLVLWACQSTDSKVEDVLLAKVYDKELYLEELKDMIPNDVSLEDSTLLSNAYVERWVRQEIKMHDAERIASKNIDIPALVEAYRKSLILHNYEREIVRNHLDSIISPTVLSSYYDRNKDRFYLTQELWQVRVMQFPKSLSQAKKSTLKDDWIKRKMPWDKLYGKWQSDVSSVYADTTWQYKNEWAETFPDLSTKWNLLKEKKREVISDEHHFYFFDVLEMRSSGDYAPLAFIRNKLSREIIQKRKIYLIDSVFQYHHEKAMDSDNIKIYPQ